jgi:hypothetical protein
LEPLEFLRLYHCTNQNKLDEVEKMYQQALAGSEKAIGPEIAAFYVPALNTVHDLDLLFGSHDNRDRVSNVLEDSRRYQEVSGHNHPSVKMEGRAYLLPRFSN